MSSTPTEPHDPADPVGPTDPGPVGNSPVRSRRVAAAVLAFVPLIGVVAAGATLGQKSFTSVEDLSARSTAVAQAQSCPGPFRPPEQTTGTDEALAEQKPADTAQVRTLALEPDTSLLFGQDQVAATRLTEDGTPRTPTIDAENRDGTPLDATPVKGKAEFATASAEAGADGAIMRSTSFDSQRPIADTIQAVRTESGDFRSLALTRCWEPRVKGTFVGVSTMPGSSSVLVLTNTTDRPSSASLTVNTADGEADPQGRGTIVVAPGATERIPMESIAPGFDSLGVSVTVQGSPLAMSMETSERDGLTPHGGDIATAQQAPSTDHVFPGATITAGRPLKIDLLNSTGQPTTATVRFISPTGEVKDREMTDVQIPASGVLQLDTGALPRGAYTVTVESEAPVFATIRSSVFGSDQPGETTSKAVDFTIQNPSDPIRNSSVLALPLGGADGQVRLFGLADTTVTVIGTKADGSLSKPVTKPVADGQTLSIAANEIDPKPEELTGLIVVPETPSSITGDWVQTAKAGSSGPIIGSVRLADNNVAASGVNVRLQY